jgi:cell division septal protein FtsQ
VRVTERKPALVLSLGAARWTIDSSGRVLTAGVVKKRLPVLAGVQVATIEPGGRVQTAEAVAALEVWRGLPRRLRTCVVVVVAPTLERISLKLKGGILVRYGAAEDMAAKNEVIRVVLGRLRSSGRSADYVDVRVPTAPAISHRD